MTGDATPAGHGRRPRSEVALPAGSWWDWDVVSCDAARLRLGAGHDLSYHHGLEIVFHGPLLVDLPTAFRDPVFRAPTGPETEAVAERLGELPAVLVAFEADAGGPKPTTCLVAADDLEIRVGLVFRYWRDELAEGQSFAPWVRPPER